MRRADWKELLRAIVSGLAEAVVRFVCKRRPPRK